ncbi:glutamyl-tRNA reductase [Flavicella sediminum]|uniref:glutamyl-tRNA reductase n=1 Tax=Flavicella sediminum TaxID=2585141 RepID=UPI00111E12DF|nr:glutamyl-tRNA reductase [Flavicella sediminum]
MSLEIKNRKLYNVGLSYKKADATTRGAFSITKENQKLLLKDAKNFGIDGVFVLSTCNRTEIMGFAYHPFELISLLCKYSSGEIEDFVSVSNVYKDKDAIRHLFKTATGLDSQILGDYEIVGQLKESFKLAQKHKTLNAYLERLINLVLQASKKVKNSTKLSSGTTSVSYAAVQYVVDKVEDYSNKNILVYGLGDIGKNTCKNLIEYAQNKNVTLINRTESKAKEFVKEHPLVKVSSLDKLTEEISKADILIVSTGANVPTVTLDHITTKKELLILDLSMPENVDRAVLALESVSLVNIDELSKITDKTIEERQKEVPKAEAIIMSHKAEFIEWLDHRKFTPAVNALKESLMTIQNDEIDFQSKKIKDFNAEQAEVITSRMIQKITTQFVKHLKAEDTSVDQSIEVISKMFDIEINE